MRPAGGDNSTFDSEAWDDWEQEMGRQNQEMYEAKEQWQAPGPKPDNGWEVLEEDKAKAADLGQAGRLVWLDNCPSVFCSIQTRVAGRDLLSSLPP